MERTGEVAILYGHIPPGTWNCGEDFSWRFGAIQERFQHVIWLNLFGHTHKEEFEVVWAFKSNKAVGVNIVSASLTPFTDKNPSFWVITLDKKTLVPLKVETHFLNLTKANALSSSTEPSFEYFHDYISEYGMRDLSPSSFLKLSLSFSSNWNLAQKYMYNFFVGGFPMNHKFDH